MALTVEDGSGIAGADSYSRLDELDDYHLRLGNVDWPPAPEPTDDQPEPLDPFKAQKEAAARRAARYLDATYGGRVGGARKNPDQGLLWPRLGARDRAGRPLDAERVPAEYKQAQAEVARLVCLGIQLTPETSAGPRLKRQKIDALEKEWFEGAPATAPVFGWLNLILSPLFGEIPEPGAAEVWAVDRS